MMNIRGNRIVIPLVILILALLLTSNLLLRLFFLSVMVLLISYFWALIGTRGIRVQFGELPERSQVGASFDEDITVFNDSRIPKLLLKLEENTDMPGYNNLMELNLRPKSSLHWQTRVYCQRRGRYHLGSATVTAGDPFGIFWRNHHSGEPRHILVHPETLELPLFDVSTPSNLGDSSSGWLLGQTGTNASGVREFVNGDSLMHIHWPSTARSGKLMVKMFDDGRAPSSSEDVYVILDMHRASHQCQGDEGTEEHAVTVAASLVKKYMDRGLQVGLVISGDPLVSFLPGRDEEHYSRMMEALALVQANGEMPIDHVIASRMKPVISDSTVVVVSPATTPLLADAVRQLRVREVLVSVVLLDPASFGGITSSSNLARQLRWLGIPVYIARKGEELFKVLDRRTTPSPVPSI
ncbi:MAG: DUF58 domain-containing protein [Dehalococcoidales bacterium]|nr:DUF58 domain-containing protein [Dehalococcoidales bacterium]